MYLLYMCLSDMPNREYYEQKYSKLYMSAYQWTFYTSIPISHIWVMPNREYFEQVFPVIYECVSVNVLYKYSNKSYMSNMPNREYFDQVFPVIYEWGTKNWVNAIYKYSKWCISPAQQGTFCTSTPICIWVPNRDQYICTSMYSESSTTDLLGHL